MDKKDFKSVIDNANYISVENTMEKTANEVAEEIREIIRSWGWPCLDESFDEEADSNEWFEENHPSETKREWSGVSNIEFLCENEYMCDNHDVDYYTFNISFYGNWETEIGVFSVTI